nr:DUF6175 family protein [uncultured Carboxylicivirga sp.]
MKRILLFYITIFSITISFAQAKKPTLMVVPSDVWCYQNGFVTDYDDQGSVINVPDYSKVFQQDANVKQVISAINGLMAERGFPLKDLESVLKDLRTDEAEAMLITSKTGGEVSESPIDLLRKTAKADIILELTWTVNEIGPKKSITYNLRGLDAYSNKQVATATGTGMPSFAAPLPTLLEEAVTAHMDNFVNTLQDHFDDMFTNGREVVLRIRVWDDWGEDLESEFGPDDEELGIIIENWLADNTVSGRFNTSDITESMANFEQVRIPIYNERGRAIDARVFAGELRKYLKSEPFNIESKVVTKGLGRATLILGGK